MELIFVVGSGINGQLRTMELAQAGFAVYRPGFGGLDELRGERIFKMVSFDAPREWRARLAQSENEILTRCDAVYFCNGWRDDANARTYLEIAKHLRKQLYFEGVAEPQCKG